ncbi:fumarylacetoacetate hydrolase family protein [Devosia sp. RR2S18]|uniref:fumarylacetoacetate hydrolase family protein n=1 Tax=Devosia rhizosphaerae TaxID=3049774 RepID=UPI0025404791|nr:fumarylacetoacetate hydrolase family protein [Devosia sp. RR2S18]WIJ26390.1 fumarylacetoacetate hydrolase family protein [Devosia sp. RR2S18]
MAAAYAIQDETIAALGCLGAWKISPVPQQGEPFCSPLPAESLHTDGTQLSLTDFKGLGVEVEVAVTLARDLAAGSSPQDARQAIGSVHLALELLSSRYSDRTAVPQLAAFADLQSNGAIVLGPAIYFGEMPEFGTQALSLELDGERAAETAAGSSTDNVLAALAWLADHASRRGSPLTAGTVVTTGARLGPVDFGGRKATANAPGLGAVTATFHQD